MGSTLIETARTAAGMTKDELASLAGTSRPTLSAYEHGRKSPTLETAARALFRPQERQAAVLASAGIPTYATQIRLLDEQGNEVPEGEAGEIVALAPNMMSGYLDNPEATAETLRDGWLHTGDIARRDAQGYLTIVDRKKDMIVSGGFNVFPREVEDVLFEHPAVAQAAVIGVPHERWGEEVKALVVLREGQTAMADEIIDYVKSRKGSLMAPKSVEFIDAIPVTNLGKVDKKALRASYWRGQARNI